MFRVLMALLVILLPSITLNRYSPTFLKTKLIKLCRIRKIRDANCETPVNFFETMNEWALESIGLIAFDTRLGVMDNPRASELNQVERAVKNICSTIHNISSFLANQKHFRNNF